MKMGVTNRMKGDERVRTRAKLIEAAAAVIGEKGYDRASLEEIAARAGIELEALFMATLGTKRSCFWP